MDLEIKEFEQSLVNFINNTVLPIEVKRLVLAEVMVKVEVEVARIIKMEQEEKNIELRKADME